MDSACRSRSSAGRPPMPTSARREIHDFPCRRDRRSSTSVSRRKVARSQPALRCACRSEREPSRFVGIARLTCSRCRAGPAPRSGSRNRKAAGRSPSRGVPVARAAYDPRAPRGSESNRKLWCCRPVTSKTVRMSLSRLRRRPRPSCWRSTVALSVGRNRKRVLTSGMSTPSLKRPTTQRTWTLPLGRSDFARARSLRSVSYVRARAASPSRTSRSATTRACVLSTQKARARILLRASDALADGPDDGAHPEVLKLPSPPDLGVVDVMGPLALLDARLQGLQTDLVVHTAGSGSGDRRQIDTMDQRISASRGARGRDPARTRRGRRARVSRSIAMGRSLLSRYRRPTPARRRGRSPGKDPGRPSPPQPAFSTNAAPRPAASSSGETRPSPLASSAAKTAALPPHSSRVMKPSPSRS